MSLIDGHGSRAPRLGCPGPPAGHRPAAGTGSGPSRTCLSIARLPSVSPGVSCGWCSGAHRGTGWAVILLFAAAAVRNWLDGKAGPGPAPGRAGSARVARPTADPALYRPSCFIGLAIRFHHSLVAGGGVLVGRGTCARPLALLRLRSPRAGSRPPRSAFVGKGRHAYGLFLCVPAAAARRPTPATPRQAAKVGRLGVSWPGAPPLYLDGPAGAVTWWQAWRLHRPGVPAGRSGGRGAEGGPNRKQPDG